MTIIRLIVFLFISTPAFGLEFIPYLGLDFLDRNWNKRDNDHRFFFTKKHPGVSWYIGNDFSDFFAVELSGYRTREKNFDTAIQDYFGVAGSGISSFHISSRHKGFALDAVLKYKPYDLEYDLFVGISTNHTYLRIVSDLSTNVERAVNYIDPCNNSIPHLGIGVKYLNSKYFIRSRLSVDFSNLYCLDLKSLYKYNPLFVGVSRKVYNLGVTFSIGVGLYL